MLCCRFILVHSLIVLARSELLQSENHERPTSTTSAICNAECNQHLEKRLEAIEAAVRTIVSAVSSQTSDLFAPIKEIFQQDPSVKSILSLNFTTSTITSSGKNSTFIKNNTGSVMKGNSNGNLLIEKNTAVENLKGAVKCSLAHLVDINTIDFNSNLNNSTNIAASLTNESLEITWPILSNECVKFSSGVWIRVQQQTSENEYQMQQDRMSFNVPQKCLKKKSKTSYSIVLSPPNSTGKKNSCFFSLTRHLIQCRAYVVEVILNYQSLRGKTLRTEVVVPPKEKKSDESKSLISVAAHSNSLMFNWEDNSGCAPQLTSFTLKIFQVKENHVSYWNVSKISTPQCKSYYEGASGTIKSPNYPMLYPHLTDCRWTISVAPGSKVRLLFAFFETQESADFISVYDGSTVHAKLLLTESGSVATPFVITSSTNEVLIRFTSDGDTSFPGFLAVYSSI